MSADDGDDRGDRTADNRGLLRVYPLPMRLAADELPEPGIARWTRRRKLAVVAAILDRRVSIEVACERYGLSAEEILSWRNLVDRFGPDGLSALSLRHARPRGRD